MSIRPLLRPHSYFIGLICGLFLFAAGSAQAVLYRMPLSSDTSVHYYLDEDSGGGVLDWNCGPSSYNGHRGTDFSGGPRGRAILAAADGTIYYAIDGYGDGYAGNTDGGGFGNHIRLVHSDNYVTIYGHMNVNSVTTKPLGSSFVCGEQIGGVGTSGNSTGLHLHFEVRPCTNCVSVDPFSGPCATPVSRWVGQPGGHPTNTCENGLTGPPTAPNLLTATAFSTSQINLGWADNAVNESGYKIERATLPSGTWSQIASLSSNVTSYSSTGLDASSTYFYRVCCTNASGESAFTYLATASTSNSAPVVNVISNITVVGGTTVNFTSVASDAGIGLTTMITGYETNAPGTQYVMFRDPLYSGSTAAYITSPDISRVTATFPAGNSSTRVNNINWGFTASANAWLRLTTASAPLLPNPTVDFNQVLRFDIYTDKSLKIGLGLRETSTSQPIGANGGGAGDIELVGVTNVAGATPAPTRIITASNWTTLAFNIPAEPVRALTGNGVLTSSTGKGTLEELTIAPNAGGGVYNVFLDNFTSTLSNRYTFSLDAGAPAGATINSNSGVFNWVTPTVSVTTTNSITVRVTDNGSPSMNATRTFQIIRLATGSPPPAPVATAATAVNSSGFTANWNSSSGATGYRLDVSTNSGFANYVAGYQDLDVGNVLLRAVSGLNSGVTYYYRARAYNVNGTSGNSSTITVLTAPATPTANAATSITTNSFTANWSASSGATGYRLDISTNSSFNDYLGGYNNLDVGNVVSRSVTSLNANTTFYYRLRAYNTGGTSSNSSSISVTTSVGAPQPPIASEATSVTTNSFTANWTNSDGATGYRLDVSLSSTFTGYIAGYSNLDVGNVISRSVTNLTIGTSNYYRVRAYSGGGTSGNSDTITAVTVPAAPVANAATNVGDTGFVANWNTVSGATGYRLDVSTNSGFSNYLAGYEDLDVKNEVTNNVSGLDSLATYYYRVRAYNPGGASLNSGTITTTTTEPTCSVNPLLNASFEGSNISGVATNWTGYQRAPNPATVWSIQTASPPTGGGTQYQQIANTSSTGGGGVRQNVTGCTIGATYTIAGWFRGNSASATCTVKVSPTASTVWSSALNLIPAQTYSGASWTAFSGTQVATSTNMTIWLDGQTGSTGVNKAECFDMISVVCTLMSGSPNEPAELRFTGIRLEGTSVVMTWRTTTGKNYRVEYKNNLSDTEWTRLGQSDLVAEGAALSTSDSISASSRRYYRVLQVP